MAFVAEEVRKEQVPEFPYRAASPEFFFLLQRIDRLDEKFSGLFATLDAKLTGQIGSLRQEMREELAALRREIREEIAGLRQDARGGERSTKNLILGAFGVVLAALAIMGTALGSLLK